MRNLPGNRFALLPIVPSVIGLAAIVSCGVSTTSALGNPQVKDNDLAIDVVKLWGLNEAGLTKTLGKPKTRVVSKDQDDDSISLTFGPAKGFSRMVFTLRESPFNKVPGWKGKTVCEFTGVLKDYVPSESAPSFAGFNPMPKQNPYNGAFEDWTKIVGFDMAWPGSNRSLYYFQVNTVGTPFKSNPLSLKKGERVLVLASD